MENNYTKTFSLRLILKKINSERIAHFASNSERIAHFASKSFNSIKSFKNNFK
jgi:hypothetical protein